MSIKNHCIVLLSICFLMKISAIGLTSTALEGSLPLSPGDHDAVETSLIEVKPIAKAKNSLADIPPKSIELIKFKLLNEFPDLGGIINFSDTKNISDTLCILTNPKSGSHLLLYSIMKITGRPMRGRLPLWNFLYDPACFEPENIMNYPLDFTKPTMYWGHEYFTLLKMNNNNNKLIFTIRNYKENILSQIILKKIWGAAECYQNNLEECFLKEILEEDVIFREFIYRLQVFDNWNPDRRCLVKFEDLVENPKNFIPNVMEFIGDNSEYESFINNYDSFKKELLSKYQKKENNTGSESNLRFFRQFISAKTLHEVDDYVATAYPILWERYLQEFKEQDQSVIDVIPVLLDPDPETF